MNAAEHTSLIPAWLRPAPDSIASHMRRAGQRPKLQALNLLWSAWLVVPIFFMPTAEYFVAALIVTYPVFLLLFALVYVRPYGELRTYSSILVLLGCASMPFNPAGWTYCIFGCVYVPYDGTSLRPSILWVVLYELLMVMVSLWLGWPWEIQLMMVGITSSAGLGGLMSRVSHMKQATERLSQEEVKRLAVHAERERIGRDLHDLLGHTLSLITLKLELARKLFDSDPERTRVEVVEAEAVARHALAEVRAAVTGIRATGLAGELASARLMLRTAGVEFAADDMPALPSVIDDTLALVLREAVTNIHRHAGARHACVEVTLAAGDVRMRVIDDGRGGVSASGNGLHGMRERVAAMGGVLHIHSQPGEGTELLIEMPLPTAQAVASEAVGTPSEAGVAAEGRS